MIQNTTTTTETEHQDRATMTPSTDELPVDTLLGWLHDMMVIREFEIRTMQSYQEAKIGGFCHIYSGQEAVAVGSVAAVHHDDPVITAYRDHGHALARGIHPKYVMAEMFGKLGGCAKGKGGSMHMFDVRKAFYGGHGIVAGQTPLAVGLAFAIKYENEVLGTSSRKVTLCFLGDGALNQGAFHESMNLASVLELPIVYIVENNRYAMGTAIERGTSMAHDLGAKAVAYGMPFASIDGMDVRRVYTDLKKMADWCRSEVRPAFVEMRTYRFKGHSMSDPQKYRSKEEVAHYEGGDPIRTLADHLMEAGRLSEDEFKSMSKDIRRMIKDAIKWSNESPDPDPAVDLYSDVYTQPYGPFRPTSPPMMWDDQTES